MPHTLRGLLSGGEHSASRARQARIERELDLLIRHAGITPAEHPPAADTAARRSFLAQHARDRPSPARSRTADRVPSHPVAPFSPIEDCLEDLRAGRMIILTDDEDRENEGDLVLAAEHVTAEAVTFMLSVARGYLCVSLDDQTCDRLNLAPQSAVNTSARGTPFTVSVDGHPRHGFTTGVSAAERARCIRMLADPASTEADFVRPGHINPLRARPGGVLVRAGQTEGSVDLCTLAGLRPAAVIIEIMRDDGEMARLPDLEQLAARHDIRICSVAQIIAHRLARQSLVRRLQPLDGTQVETAQGRFNLIAFESIVDPLPHLALTLGGVGDLDPLGRPLPAAGPTLVRMHRRHLLGDIFGQPGSARAADGSPASSAQQLHAAMRAIQADGRGAVVYLRPQGAPDRDAADLSQALTRLRRPSPETAPPSDGPDLIHPAAVPMDVREYGTGGQILRELGITELRLLTNSHADLPGLDAFGLRIAERVPL